MAGDESSGLAQPAPYLTLLDVQRVAEQAFRLESWGACQGGRAGDEWTADQFAEAVAQTFQVLLAHHAEQAGYGFLRAGIGAGVAEAVAAIPAAWRPGWPWSGLAQRSRLPR